MKTTTIFLWLFVLTGLSASVSAQSGSGGSANQNVPIEIAREVAKKHYYKYVNLIQYVSYNDIHFSQEKAVVDNSDTLYYIFNCDNNKGFVIVASDYRIQPILGYAFEGNLNDSIS